MKVLIIAFGHPDNVFSLAHYLGEKVDLTVLYIAVGDRFTRGILDLKFDDNNHGYFNSEKYINKYFPGEIINYAKGKFKIEILRLPSNKIIRDVLLKNFRFIKNLCKIIRSRNYDVIHYNGTGGFLLYFRYFLRGIPRIWTLHDFKSHSGEQNKKSELFLKFIVKNIDIIQHYKFLRKSIIKYYSLKSGRVHLLYSGSFDVYTQFNGKEIIKENNYVLFFGRIEKYKGLNILLDAYNKIKNPGSKLVVAGSGNLSFDISRFKINNNIIFINRYIETGELVSLIKNSSFVVVPYIDATQSGVIDTAYAFNKPVLATNIDGLPEVVIDNYTGNLFEKNNKNDLMKKLENLMNNGKIINLYEYNIKKFKTEGIISWGKIVKEYLKVYEKIIARNE